MSTTITYKGDTLTTVENNTKVLKTAGKYMEGDVTLTDVSRAAPTIQSLSITPSESAQTFNASSVDGYKPVSVNAISSTYVGSGITRRSSTDLTASGAIITAPAGYYSTAASKSVASGSATGPSSLSVSSATITTGTNTITLTKTDVTTTPTVSAGYISSATTSTATVALTASITVNPTPTVSDATVTIPVGYYTTQTTKSVAAGTAGTPTATKGTVSNHAVSVTPSVTNTTGYVTGGTKTGTSVSVSASELVSGNLAITSNGTGINVANYSTVSVDVVSNPNIETLTQTPSSNVASLSFTVQGEPKVFFLKAYILQNYYISMIRYNGTNILNWFYYDSSLYQNTFISSFTYNNNILTINANTFSGTQFKFRSGYEYELTYVY